MSMAEELDATYARIEALKRRIEANKVAAIKREVAIHERWQNTYDALRISRCVESDLVNERAELRARVRELEKDRI